MPEAIFVYGTLKTGECRETVFKDYLKKGFEVIPASIKGDLYNLGPFPAILHGDNTIHGEIIIPIDSNEMENIIRVLDRIEGYYGEGHNNLYNREVVLADMSEKTQIEAITYFFADEEQLKSEGVFMSNGIWGRACHTKKTMVVGA